MDLLLADPPEHVVLPPEPAYEDAVENPTAQSERDRRTRDEQANTAWKNHCLRIEAVGVLFGDKPWKLCDRKAFSLMYLSRGTEGQRVFNSKNSTVNLDEISTRSLWDILNETFILILNITFDRYLFLTENSRRRNQLKNSTGISKNFLKTLNWEKREIPLSEMFLLQTCKMKTFKHNF